MKKFSFNLFGLFVFGFILFSSFSSLEITSEKETLVEWYSFEDAIELNKKEPRKIIIDIYTTWCGPCKIMDKQVFQDRDIAKYMNENFYPVKFDGEYKEDLVFEGETYSFIKGKNGGGVHELTLALTDNQPAYPTVIFMDEDLEMIRLLSGVQKKDLFNTFLKYVHTNAYETEEWFEFSGQQ